QQQRVALARAVVTRPKVLLMDEPLSNLDARLREQMRIELKKITNSIGVTTLYVTHDQAEALSLGDRVCVMNEGEILQVGSPQEVYSQPPNLFVAQFVGEMNFIKGKVTGPAEVDLRMGTLHCALPSKCQVGNAVTLAIRPEHLSLLHGPDQKYETAEGRITSKTYLGDAILFELEASGVTLIVKHSGDTDFAIGQQARVVLPKEHWHVYPAD
ncbi:MAG: ABC transporter ATP-binding protein, partial [Candidatus Binatia bacterium]